MAFSEVKPTGKNILPTSPAPARKPGSSQKPSIVTALKSDPSNTPPAPSNFSMPHLLWKNDLLKFF
jgi:hypothetical protein